MYPNMFHQFCPNYVPDTLLLIMNNKHYSMALAFGETLTSIFLNSDLLKYKKGNPQLSKSPELWN